LIYVKLQMMKRRKRQQGGMPTVVTTPHIASGLFVPSLPTHIPFDAALEDVPIMSAR
jgi:hypothetical protein